MIASLSSAVRSAVAANPRKFVAVLAAALVVTALAAGMAGAYGLRGNTCFSGYDYNSAASAACDDAVSSESRSAQATMDWGPAYKDKETQFYGSGYDPSNDANEATSFTWHWD